MDAVVGEHLLVGDTPAELVDAIQRVLDNPRERERLSIEGRARVVARHAWASAMLRMDGIVDRCAGSFGSSARVLNTSLPA